MGVQRGQSNGDSTWAELFNERIDLPSNRCRWCSNIDGMSGCQNKSFYTGDGGSALSRIMQRILPPGSFSLGRKRQLS